MAGKILQHCVVYGLASSEDGQIRYIGQTKRPVKKRLGAHISEARRAKTNTHRNTWIRSVLNRGHYIVLIVIDENATWNDTEISLIAEFRDKGVSLVNATSGGDGMRDVSDEIRKKISDKLKGRKLSDEQRKSMIGRRRGIALSDEHRKNIKDGIRKAYDERGQEIRQKISVSSKGKERSEEWRKNIGNGRRGKLHTQEVKDNLSVRMMEHFSNIENRKKTSESTKIGMARKEVKDKMAKATADKWARPESRRQASDRVKRRFSNIEERTKQARRRAKLSDEQVLLARKMRKEGVSYVQLSLVFCISQSALYQLCNGNTYRHIPIE